jgi:hypothetical protein
MKAEEAEVLMQGFRPGKATDSRTQKAVEYAEGHDTLKLRLEEQRQFDQHVGDIIRCIQPPGNLREKLVALSGQLAPRRGALKHHALLPVLAGVLVLVGIAIFFRMQNATRFEGREAVEGMIAGTAALSGAEVEPVTSTAGQLGDWFYMRGFEGYTLPPELAPLPAVGSRVAAVDGRTVAQVVVEEHELVLHVFDAAKFGVGLAPGGPWQVFTHEGWAAAVRRVGPTCFLLTTQGTAAEMEAILQSLSKP